MLDFGLWDLKEDIEDADSFFVYSIDHEYYKDW